MIKFLKVINEIKKIRKIKPDEKWLEGQRRHFIRLLDIESAPDANPLFRGRFWFGAVSHKFFQPVLIVFLLFGFFGGLVNFSQIALPNESFYFLKLFSEQTRGYFIFNQTNRLNFSLRMIQRRLEEIDSQNFISDFNSEAVLAALSGIENNLEKTVSLLDS